MLVVDDTALVKQGKPSVGVKRQYGGQLGKKANCQSMVSLTLARREVPVGATLRARWHDAQGAARERAVTVAALPLPQ